MQKYLNHQNALKRILILIMQIFNYVLFLDRLNQWTLKTKIRTFSDLENFCFNHLNREKLPNPDLGNVIICVILFCLCQSNGSNGEMAVRTFEGEFFSVQRFHLGILIHDIIYLVIYQYILHHNW